MSGTRPSLISSVDLPSGRSTPPLPHGHARGQVHTPSSGSLLPAPVGLLLSTWLSESAWFYLVLGPLVAVASPGAVFTPAAVLFPYAMAAVTTLLLGIWASSTSTLERRTQKLALTLTLSQRERGLALTLSPWERVNMPEGMFTGVRAGYLGSRALPLALNASRAVAIAALNLLLGLVCLLSVTWWELYRAEKPLDPSWIGLALSEARTPLGALPPLAWLVVLAIFLWWRGTHLARAETDFPQLLSRFFWGTAILLVLVAMGADLPEAGLATWSLAGYLLFGLVALSLARLEATQQQRLAWIETGRHWRTPVVAMLLLAGGFGVAFLLLPQLEGLALWLRDLLVNVILPLLWEIWRGIVHLLGLDKPPEPLPITPGEGAGLPSGERESLFTLPEKLREIGRRLFDLSWITILLYGLYSWVKQWRWDRRQRGGSGQLRERIPWRFNFSPRAILFWLFHRLLARWPRLSRWVGWPAAPGERAWTIRELYRKLLRWGAGRGRSREPWTTPREYQAALSAEWPALEADFRALTESYLRARYGGLDLTPQELEIALAGWLSIAKKKGDQTASR